MTDRAGAHRTATGKLSGRDGTSVLERAHAWITEVHPHARHLERTVDWLLKLEPGASEATRIAAVTHDIERAYPVPPLGRRDWDNPAYNRWHQDRCADIVATGLGERGAEEGLVRSRRSYVRTRTAAGRGGSGPGRRRAVVPGDDGAAARRLGGDRQGATGARGGQAAPLRDGSAPTCRERVSCRRAARAALSRLRAANEPARCATSPDWCARVACSASRVIASKMPLFQATRPSR